MIIGRRFELWQSEYVKDAYEDQMGVKRAAQVVRRKVIVTVVDTRDIVGGWSGETHKDGYWIAKDEAGVEYTNSFDELSMGGRDSWWDGKSSWKQAQSRGWFDPYINPDGTKAVPQELNLMCCGCWERYGSPNIVNDKVLAAVPLIEEVYYFHGAGGSLHIVLDDMNLEDSSLDFCDGEIAKGGYGADEDQLDAERECSAALRVLTEQERASALAIYRGYFKP